MSVMGKSVAGAALALMGLAACGNGGTPLVPGGGGGTTPAAGMGGGGDDAYQSCKEQEKLGDATTCWKKWMADFGNTGDSPQKDYAKMYVSQHPGANPNIAETHTPTGGATSSNGVKVIPVDPEQEKRGAPSGGGGGGVQWPAKTMGDKECWDHMKLTGKFVDDYNELSGRCGKPTGMLPFSKPVTGELGPDNKGDIYTIKLVGGGCYRFFAVADSSIKDLDVAIATMENKVVWVDKNEQAVAIVDWDKAVCVEKDVQFKFIVALDGAGSGGYGFGIWVRPNSG